MKKRTRAAIAVFLIVAMVMLIPGCMTPADPTQSATNGTTRPTIAPTVGTTQTIGTIGTTVTTVPTEPTVPTVPTTATVPSTTVPTVPATQPTTIPIPPTTEAAPPETTVPEAPGVVRWYTCNAQQYATYLALAEEYSAATGTEVRVITPVDSSCEEALSNLIASGNTPTLFCIHSQQMLQDLQSQLYDLSGTQPANALYSLNFARVEGDRVLALAMDVGGSGLIYNASKLAIAGFSESDIRGFSGLKTTVSHITANKSSLGHAFTAPDFKDEHLMAHLAGLYPDADQLRAFVDMYIKNCTVKTTTLQYFTNGTTVFYIGGTGEYEEVAAIGDNNLRFLPAYSADTNMVQCFSDHYWAVSADASSADIAVTLDFWTWLVTAESGYAPIDRLQMLSPYQQSGYSANILEKKLREYISTGNAYVTWNLSGKVTDLAAFTAALKTYVSSATDANWAAVAATFA